MWRIMLILASVLFVISCSQNNEKAAKTPPPKKNIGYPCKFAYSEEEAPECFDN